MEKNESPIIPGASYPSRPPTPSPSRYKLNRGKILLVVLGVLVFYLAASFAMSFRSGSTLRTFQKQLEEGAYKNPSPGWNPFNALQAGWHQAGAESFKKAVESYDGRLGPMKDSYPAAVAALAYRPKDTETLSLIARYYFLSGMRLPSESLALQAVSLNPYDLYARRAVVLCQALPPEQRLQLLGRTWSLMRTQTMMINSVLPLRGKEKLFYFVMRFLGGILMKDKSDIPWLSFISYSDRANRQRLAELKKEEDWLKFQFAFCLFLTDPLRWKEDALDCLLSEGAGVDPQNQEHQCVVNAWVAEWMEDSGLIAEASKRMAEAKLADPLGQKRLQDFKAAFESEKGYDRQVDALKVYDSLHPLNDPVWMRMENDALSLPEMFEAAGTEPEGGAEDMREWLAKISSGEQSPLPGRKKEDYTYPQTAEVKLLIDQRLKDKATLTPCPILMPLKDAKGRYSPLGAYLSIQAITLASFPGRQVLGFWSPFSKYKAWNLLAHSSQAHGHLLQELTEDSGADSHADGTLLEKNGGWQVSLNFQGAHPPAGYAKTFKKGQLYLIPGWMAERLHAWMGTRLNKAQRPP